MDERQAPVSESELEVLKTLWEVGACTVRTVNAALQRRGRRWAYTTVQTLLQRLEAKGYVACDRGGPAHVFRAAVSPRDWSADGCATWPTSSAVEPPRRCSWRWWRTAA